MIVDQDARWKNVPSGCASTNASQAAVAAWTRGRMATAMRNPAWSGSDRCGVVSGRQLWLRRGQQVSEYPVHTVPGKGSQHLIQTRCHARQMGVMPQT